MGSADELAHTRTLPISMGVGTTTSSEEPAARRPQRPEKSQPFHGQGRNFPNAPSTSAAAGQLELPLGYGYYTFRLEPFRAFLHLKLDGLPLGQCPIAVGLNRGKVYEYVLTRLPTDESVAFRRVEPLHYPLLSHFHIHLCSYWLPAARVPARSLPISRMPPSRVGFRLAQKVLRRHIRRCRILAHPFSPT